MIPTKTKFNIYHNDIKKFFKEFRGSWAGNVLFLHKELCAIHIYRLKDYFEITKFSPEGTMVIKRYSAPETIIDFIENLRDSEIDFKLKKHPIVDNFL